MKGLNIPAALRVAHKDIVILLKERGTLVYLFVVPLVFILGFIATAGLGRDAGPSAIPLPVVNLDAGSEASAALIEALNQGTGLQCELYEEARAAALFDRGGIERLLTIPAHYGADLAAGGRVTLRLVSGPDASATKTQAVHTVVTGVAADLSLKTQLLAAFRQMADMQAGSEQQAFTAETVVEQATSQYERSKTEPLVAIEERWPEHLVQEDEAAVSPLTVNLAGYAVLFIFLTAQTTAQSIYREKKVGTFRRLLAAPIGKATILAGKMAPNFLTGLAQTVVLLGAGVLLSPLLGFGRLSLGSDPLALVLLCTAILLCSTCLGVLIAALARTEGQISGLSQVVLWGAGFAGIFLARLPGTSLLNQISRAIPHHWANVAFVDLFCRGAGLAEIAPSLLALLGFSVVFLGVGLWRLDWAKT